MTDNVTDIAPAAATAEPQFMVRAQYIKDFSFENPRAPQSLIPRDDKPALGVGVDINATRLTEDAYEVVLHINVKAEAANEVVFMVDLAYAGLFHISNVDQQRIETMMFIDCPQILFPFARRIVADATRDGGFPPLLMEPIDFYHLYQQRKKVA